MSNPWPAPPPPGGGSGRPTSNGLALAAMLIGLVAAVMVCTVLLAFVSFIPGIVAMGLGYVSLKRSRQRADRVGRLQSLVAIGTGVFASLGSLAAFAIVALFVASGDSTLTNERPAAPDQYELQDQGCVVEGDQAVSTGVLVNRSGVDHGFSIDVRFFDGPEELGLRADELTSDLSNGQSWAWTVTLPLDPTDEVDTDGLQCDVDQVVIADVVSD